MSNQGYTCCICGKKFAGWGNNPYPVVKEENARCCDYCNNDKVLAARLAQMFSNKEDN